MVIDLITVHPFIQIIKICSLSYLIFYKSYQIGNLLEIYLQYLRYNFLMITPNVSNQISNQRQSNNAKLKLPKMSSKISIDLTNRKNSLQTDRKFPKLKVQLIGPEKENFYTQNIQKTNQKRQNNIKEGLEALKQALVAIKQAQQKVKNLFIDPQMTMNIGGQTASSEYKIDLNREMIKKFRNQNYTKRESANLLDKVQQFYKNKSLTFQQNNKRSQEKSLKKMQIDQRDNSQDKKTSRIIQKNNLKEFLNMKTERKGKIREKGRIKLPNKNKDPVMTFKNQTVFVPTQQTLNCPYTNQNQKQSKLHGEIRQLESKLKKMSSFQEKDLLIGKKQRENFKSNKQLNYPRQSARDWTKVQFCNQKKSLKCLKSIFDQQMNHINLLQKKSRKSIQHMVQNRKMLMKLNLRNQLRKQ